MVSERELADMTDQRDALRAQVTRLQTNGTAELLKYRENLNQALAERDGLAEIISRLRPFFGETGAWGRFGFADPAPILAARDAATRKATLLEAAKCQRIKARELREAYAAGGREQHDLVDEAIDRESAADELVAMAEEEER